MSASTTTSAPAVPQYISRLDDIFGVVPAPAPPTVTAPARAVVASSRNSATTAESAAPPSYAQDDFFPAPAYDEVQEAPTLSKYLFKYGFFFPPFWVIGVFVLFMKLEPTPETECGKTADQQKDEIAILRRTELKWSKRCLYALLSLLLIVAIIVIAVLAKKGVFKHHH